MRPSEEGVKQFQLIYKELYGKEIDVDAAREMASRVLTLYELLARPIPKDSKRDATAGTTSIVLRGAAVVRCGVRR